MNDEKTITTKPPGLFRAHSLAVRAGRVEEYGKKLIRYLSGGGLAALTRTAEEERAETKQEKFLFVAAIVGVAWLIFWIF